MNNSMVKTTAQNRNSHPATRPFGTLVSSLLGHDVSRWLEDDFWGAGTAQMPASVPVNIRETDKSYELELVAPGLEKSDFKVSLDNRQLTVSFNHQEEKQESSEGQKYLRREYSRSSFSRSFTLDETVDAANISAAYNNGVLHLTVPKKAEAQQLTRTVEVQ